MKKQKGGGVKFEVNAKSTGHGTKEGFGPLAHKGAKGGKPQTSGHIDPWKGKGNEPHKGGKMGTKAAHEVKMSAKKPKKH